MTEDPRIREQEFGNFEKFLSNDVDKRRTFKVRDILGKFLYRFKDGVYNTFYYYYYNFIKNKIFLFFLLNQ